MAFSIQTNVNSLVAQENLRVNSDFQSRTIARLTSGYRINASGDDAAGLAIANKYRSDIAELTQGVRNANDGISALQIIDGGLNNVSKVLDRLKTLATQSASTTFTGDRSTLNNEYQALLTEINRQATNIGLVNGGTYNKLMTVYTGGGAAATGSTAADNAQVTVDLSGAANRVDSTGLGINSTSVSGGGTAIGSMGTANTVRLDDSAVTFLTGGNTQVFTFQVYNTSMSAAQTVNVTANGGTTGLSGSDVVKQLNSSLSQYGITASQGSGTDQGKLVFGGAVSFAVSVAAASGGNAVATSGGRGVNAGEYRSDVINFTAFANGTGTAGSETVVFQNANGTATVTFNTTTADSLSNALNAINTQTASLGIYAVTGPAGGNTISIQSASKFSMAETAQVANVGATATGSVFGATGSQNVNDADASASSTGNALASLDALTTAVTNLGLVQGRIGTAQNKLQYSINLAQSQISNFSAAESRIRDTDVASEAANLTKAQVLQQASLAAMAQANSAPQAVLALLRG